MNYKYNYRNLVLDTYVKYKTSDNNFSIKGLSFDK